MTTGRDIAARFDARRQQIEGEIHQLTLEQRQWQSRNDTLLRERAALRATIASERLRALDADAIQARLNAADREALACFGRRDADVAAVESALEANRRDEAALRSQLDDASSARDTAVDAWQRRFDAIRARLAAGDRWPSLAERADALRSQAATVRARLEQAAADRAEKRRAYEADPLFAYLWQRYTRPAAASSEPARGAAGAKTIPMGGVDWNKPAAAGSVQRGAAGARVIPMSGAKPEVAARQREARQDVVAIAADGTAAVVPLPLSGAGLFAGLDRWVARLIGFDTARRNYAALLVLPQRLAEHATRIEAELAEVVAAGRALEEEAIVADGAVPLREAAQATETRVGELADRLAANEAEEDRLESRRRTLLSQDNEHERAARAAIDGALASLSASQLAELARDTGTRADDDAARRLADVESDLARTQQEIARRDEAYSVLIARRHRLDDARARFRKRGYDSRHARFESGFDFDGLLLRYLLGSMNGGDFMRSVSSSHVASATGLSTSSNGFGGGSFLSGGGFGGGGGGFSTGGGF